MIRSASNDRTSSAPAWPDQLAAYRAIADISGDTAILVDCAGHTVRYLTAGADQWFGCGPEELAQQLRHPGHPGPLAPLCDALAARLAGARRGRDECELEFVRHDGTTVAVQLISTFVLDDAANPVALAAVVRDQSPLRAMQAEQKRFASMLNHEFRTPLAVIDGAVQRLEASASRVDDATRQRYRKIGAAVDRLIGMLDDYLSPDRMASLGKTRPPAGVDLRVLLEESAAQARDAGRPVSMAADGLPAALRGDAQGLRLALKVLVDNALAFSPAGSQVDFIGRRVQDGVELIVHDNGPGVPPADTARIFDKSYRGSNAAGLPGSGLGLYMARSVVEVHGGTLELANIAPHGAVFKIWLPTTLNDGKVVASSEPNSDNHSNRPGATC
jgi:two-component system, OmpR family, sensor kinase